MLESNSSIVRDRKILGGKPIIRGTRISVEFILELLSSGMTADDIVRAYPFLQRDAVLAATRFAANELKHEEITMMDVAVAA